MRLKFEIQISRPRGCQEPDTQVASLGCTHYSRALAPLASILVLAQYLAVGVDTISQYGVHMSAIG